MHFLTCKEKLDARFLSVRTLACTLFDSESHVDTGELVTSSPQGHDSVQGVLMHGRSYFDVVAAYARIHSVVSRAIPAWEESPMDEQVVEDSTTQNIKRQRRYLHFCL